MSLRVALVATTTATDPPEALASRLRGLRKAGWDAHLLCKGERWREHPSLCDPVIADCVVVEPGDSRRLPRRLLRRPDRLLRYLAADGEAGPLDDHLLDLEPDLVHFHSAGAAWKALRLKPLLGCRVAVSFREDGLDLTIPGRRALWDHADLLLFSSVALWQRARDQGYPSERAEVLPGPTWEAGTARNGRPGRQGRLRLLSAGPTLWEHGLEYSVQAVRLLLDMGVDCEYVIVGEGHHHMAVAFAAHQLGLGGRVRLIPPEGDLGAQLREADVFVDPAVTDTTSISLLLTAQALAVPFVATARPGLAPDGGLFVPRRDPRALADALAGLARDPALRSRLGQAGRRRGADGPGAPEHAARLGELYRRALA